MICNYREAKLEAICIMLFPGADVSVSESVLLIVRTAAVVLRKCFSKKKKKK